MKRGTLLLLIIACVALSVAPASAGIPFVVDEDFEDGTADGFVADTICFFGESHLGSVVDDGTGNLVYSLTEHDHNEVYVSPTEVSDFDLKFDAFFVQGGPNPWNVGLPGIVFHADPGGQTGYILDWRYLFSVSPDGDGGCQFTEIGRDDTVVDNLAGPHTMRVLVKDDKIKIFRDGKLVIHMTDGTYDSGHVGIAEVNGGQILIDNLTLKVKVGGG